MVVAKMILRKVEEPKTMGKVKLKIEKTYSNVIEAAAGGSRRRGSGLR